MTADRTGLYITPEEGLRSIEYMTRLMSSIPTFIVQNMASNQWIHN